MLKESDLDSNQPNKSKSTEQSSFSKGKTEANNDKELEIIKQKADLEAAD